MILSINAGSSSIKFALFHPGDRLEKTASGQVNRIGLSGAGFFFKHEKSGRKEKHAVQKTNYAGTIDLLLKELEGRVDFSRIKGIGHRIVQGMHFTEPALLDRTLLDALNRMVSYDPDHLPYEIRLAEAFAGQHPEIPQFACFDTAFHQSMPEVARRLAIPARFDQAGIRRYGFHGLSYSYLMRQIEEVSGKKAGKRRIVLAHLGSGASLAAVRKGKSQDTSMGFSPASGIPMSSRCGDLDPGAAWYMIKSENLSPQQFNHLVNAESGLLAVSGTSGDMKDLLQQEAADPRSAAAVNLFCYQAKKCVGAFAAALGGLDMLVFSGGIGENAAEIRSRICSGMEFMGIELNKSRNKKNEAVISPSKARVEVRVIHTDEEWMIAKIVGEMISVSGKSVTAKKK